MVPVMKASITADHRGRNRGDSAESVAAQGLCGAQQAQRCQALGFLLSLWPPLKEAFPPGLVFCLVIQVSQSLFVAASVPVPLHEGLFL